MEEPIYPTACVSYQNNVFGPEFNGGQQTRPAREIKSAYMTVHTQAGMIRKGWLLSRVTGCNKLFVGVILIPHCFYTVLSSDRYSAPGSTTFSSVLPGAFITVSYEIHTRSFSELCQLALGY